MKETVPKIHIVDRKLERFFDRREAGRLLGFLLKEADEKPDVILGIPRGGIVIAAEMADILNADLDVVLARKIRAPDQEELAIGSVSENGNYFLNEGLISYIGVDEAYLNQEIDFQTKLIQQRSSGYRSLRPKRLLRGQKVVITDDGVATGSTLMAAIWSVRQEKPERLVVALPVGPQDTLEKLAADADQLYCLRVPPYLGGVGQFYFQFNQVEDEEVDSLLKKNYRKQAQ